MDLTVMEIDFTQVVCVLALVLSSFKHLWDFSWTVTPVAKSGNYN